MKIAEQQRQLEENQLVECTFHPKIIYKDKAVPDNEELVQIGSASGRERVATPG